MTTPTATLEGRPPTDQDRGPLYGFSGFARVIREITGKPMSTDTIRSYRRRGILPVADVQVGGHWPARRTRVLDDGTEVEDVETIPCWPGVRLPKPGEKIDCETYLWHEDTIREWQANRRGKKTKEGVAEGAADRDLRYPVDIKDTWWKYQERGEQSAEELERDAEDRRKAKQALSAERDLSVGETVKRATDRLAARQAREAEQQKRREERELARIERERLQAERQRLQAERAVERAAAAEEKARLKREREAEREARRAAREAERVEADGERRLAVKAAEAGK